MLLKSYTKEISRPECNPSFQSLHCIADLHQDIGEVLPYLNAVLGGFQYLKDPPAVTLRIHGKIITVHPREIAINALKDEEEADKILEWLRRGINEAWEKREEITPSYEGAPKPKVFEILKLLPKTNCRECGQPTCMVFAARVAEEGLKCPRIALYWLRQIERSLASIWSNIDLNRIRGLSHPCLCGSISLGY